MADDRWSMIGGKIIVETTSISVDQRSSTVDSLQIPFPRYCTASVAGYFRRVMFRHTLNPFTIRKMLKVLMEV